MRAGRERQEEIYLSGLRGKKPIVPVDARHLEAQAHKKMSRRGFAYIAGGAGLEETMAANRESFDRWRIVPRMLHDVSHRDLSVEIFGRRLPAPLLLAPIGALEMAHPDADLAVAKAAAAEGIPPIFSNQASVDMETCSRAMGDAPRWFQLYWSTSDELVESLVQRAETCGCEAIVVTLDTTMFGWRPRDLNLAFLPFLYAQGIAQYTSDPVFRALVEEARVRQPTSVGRVTPRAVLSLMRLARRYPGSSWSNFRTRLPIDGVRRFVDIYSRPSLTWQDLPFVRERTRLPIVLKGVLHPDDARRALDAGVDGLVVSNHGGRQVDGALGSLDALPPIVEAVAGRIPVLLDSGIRGGADAFKGLALGARAVLIGRPYAFGLGIAGERGVREVIQNFIAELDLTLGLAGCTSVFELDPQMLQRDRA
jgi:isopentenyl diphosphate isomerase/L-lactate dehydrogenase-like FMN-dependent dehydrogenase